MKKTGDKVTERDIQEADRIQREAGVRLRNARMELEKAERLFWAAQQYNSNVVAALKYGNGVLR